MNNKNSKKSKKTHKSFGKTKKKYGFINLEKLTKKRLLFIAILGILEIVIVYFAVIGVETVFFNAKDTASTEEISEYNSNTEALKLSKDISEYELDMPDIDVELLSVNKYSRPGKKLEQVNGIVVHYVANPGSSAISNRNYFENLQKEKNTKVSSHFVVGLDGEIVQCIPTSEIAYASNDRNSDTVAIECCHEDETGRFNDKTYSSLVELAAYICCKYDVDIDSVIRHYDITGKDCPLYYVVNEDEWIKLKNDIVTFIENNGINEN